jgi:phenylalanyl-tRNA synthetase beta chain
VAGARLNVRRAHKDEQVQTLDGQTRTLDEQMLLIEDADGPTSIAGVMGGARSEVSETTTTVVSEAATWNGPNIHRTSLRLGLRSEASGRFEKQLQPEQALWAQIVATKLLIEVCGASVRPGTLDIGGPGPEAQTIRLRDARIEGLLGVPIPRDRTRRHLETIGFGTVDAADGLDVTVPDFRRADITREADLIEEVARLDGLENLPATLPASRHAVGSLTARQRQRRRAVDALVSQGLHEIVGWSFTGPELARKLRLIDAGSPITLANPMSSEQSQLRTRLLGSLLDVAARNHARGGDAAGAGIRLFESGAVYRSKHADQLSADRLPQEPHHIAALLTGPVRPATWRDQSPPQADFFTAKGVLGALFAALGTDWEVRPQTQGRFLHPGRAAQVLVAGESIGWVGELHPNVAAQWELDRTVAAFEIDLDAVPVKGATIYREFAPFPDVREDLAVLVSEAVSAEQIVSLVRTAGSPLLAGAEVFDVYRDAERLGEGKVSVAVRLAYRASDRTLTDSEVAAQRQRIINALEQQLDGRIRAGE